MEYLPILAPGIHDLAVHEIQNHFSSKFPNSLSRDVLIDGLMRFIDALKGIGILFELWVDGSFTTRKPNPNDIDLVIFASEPEVNFLTLSKQNMLASLVNDRINVKKHFCCDVLFSTTEDINMRSYWRGWYGFDREEKPKGIARIMVNP